MTITTKTLHARVRWFRWSGYVGEEGPLLVFGILRKIYLKLELVGLSYLNGRDTDRAPRAEESLLVSTATLDLTLRVVDFFMCHHRHSSCCSRGILMLDNYRVFSRRVRSRGPDRINNLLWQRAEISQLHHRSLKAWIVALLSWDVLEGEHGGTTPSHSNNWKLLCLHLFFLLLLDVHILNSIDTSIGFFDGMGSRSRPAVLINEFVEQFSPRTTLKRHIDHILNSLGPFTWRYWENRLADRAGHCVFDFVL